MPRLTAFMLAFAIPALLVPVAATAQDVDVQQDCIAGCLTVSQIVPGGTLEEARLNCRERQCVGPAFVHLGTERLLVTILAAVAHDVMIIGIKNEKVALVARGDRQIRMPLH